MCWSSIRLAERVRASRGRDQAHKCTSVHSVHNSNATQQSGRNSAETIKEDATHQYNSIQTSHAAHPATANFMFFTNLLPLPIAMLLGFVAVNVDLDEVHLVVIVQIVVHLLCHTPVVFEKARLVWRRPNGLGGLLCNFTQRLSTH
jgi:hypothetical protein